MKKIWRLDLASFSSCFRAINKWRHIIRGVGWTAWSKRDKFTCFHVRGREGWKLFQISVTSFINGIIVIGATVLLSDAVNRVGKSKGVVLIQATSDNKGGTRPRKLRLNKAASADGADCDALAGALCVAFFVKHRRLPLESALELIRVRRQGMVSSPHLP